MAAASDDEDDGGSGHGSLLHSACLQNLRGVGTGAHVPRRRTRDRVHALRRGTRAREAAARANEAAARARTGAQRVACKRERVACFRPPSGSEGSGGGQTPPCAAGHASGYTVR